MIKAFVLHVRPYTDSRVIVEWLTDFSGRISTVARAPARRNLSCYQLFQPSVISFKGTGELKTLTGNDADGARILLSGSSIKCAFYMNELLVRILVKDDPAPNLFLSYVNGLSRLSMAGDEPVACETSLRGFELDILEYLGVCVDFVNDYDSGAPIQPDALYEFSPIAGFKQADGQERRNSRLFQGETLLNIHLRKFLTSQILKDAKYLCRNMIAPVLGGKPLKSRELFL